jgi:hypothetical protein
MSRLPKSLRRLNGRFDSIRAESSCWPRRRQLWAFTLCLTFNMLLGPARAGATEIWLAGVDPVVRKTFDPHTVPDYLDLFQPDAPWHKAAKAVAVFKTSTQFLVNASDQTLSRMFADLKQRHIALGMEALILTATPKCGPGIEGYSSPRTMEQVAARIMRLGGDLRYVAMDEPLDFGHYSQQPNACRSSLTELAADIAGKVQAIRRYFPEVQVGDIEGIGHSGPPDDVDAIMEWASTYEAAVGSKLSFFHLDVLWTGAWQTKMKQLATRLQAAGIKFGIIYNGNPDDQTDLEWTRHAEQRFVEIEADRTLIPHDAVLQTWMPRPTHMLPETQPGSMTALVNRYFTAETRLALHRNGSRLQGAITEHGDRPLAGVPVTVSAEFLGEQGAPVLHTRSGQVPPNAAKALFALRINAECTCSGPADVAIGPLRYQDDRTGGVVQQAFRAPGAAAPLAVFQAAPGQPITQNIPGFAVTPDDPFTIQVPMRTDLASAVSGYVALIFLDAQGKEILRLRLPFEPVEQPIGTLVTNEDGRFSLVLDSAPLHTSVGFHAEFAGDARHRSASAKLR